MASSTILYVFSHFLVQFLPMEGNKLALAPSKLTVHGQYQLAEDSLLKHIYLTFDDGPLNGTANCIDICKREKLAASFFEIGLHQSRSSKGRKLYARIKSDTSLFSLSNHSYSHAAGKYHWFYQHPDSATLDFLKGQAVLAPTNNLVRFPGNNTWDTKYAKKASWLAKPLAHKMDSLGWDVIGWDMEWRFNKNRKPVQSPEAIALLVDSLFAYNQTKTKNHLVILMHDHMFATSDDSTKLAKMVGLLKKRKHYRFDKITQYPGLKNALN